MEKILDNSEQVILSIQNHWIVFIEPTLFLIVGGILSLIVFAAGSLIASTSEFVQLLLYLLAYTTVIVAIHIYFLTILEWLISNIIITDKRIIEIKYTPFVTDDINHIELERISEIEKIKHGILRNLLNYGDVKMSVPGMKDTLHFTYINKPSKFVNLIEALKMHKPLASIDLKGIGANLSHSYLSSLKK